MDGVETTIGAVMNTGMAVDTADMRVADTVVVAGTVVADTGEVTKSNRDKHRLFLFPEATSTACSSSLSRQRFPAPPLNATHIHTLEREMLLALSARG
ncbi:hypothetical protein LMG28138_06001 [Pararobbsia alpina]|uniref:Uncharacterized protein n=1 Tax=Pararobbsia alpina TaxID=621374 RepID=A0A6S7CF46_9BURK|nr:hypothetical protein LMG28138_06001 [Pararobbsia alpina]